VSDDLAWFQDFFTSYLFAPEKPATDPRFRGLGASAVGMVVRGSVWSLRRLREAVRAGLITEADLVEFAWTNFDRAGDLILEVVDRGSNEMVVSMLLGAAMSDDDAGVRAVAALVAGMSQLDTQGLRPSVMKATNDPDEAVAIAATMALATTATNEAERQAARQKVESFVSREAPEAFLRSQVAAQLMRQMSPEAAAEAGPEAVGDVLFGMRFVDALKLVLVKIAQGSELANA
jgi:hypothetical protein